jgi:hypothetical protein
MHMLNKRMQSVTAHTKFQANYSNPYQYKCESHNSLSSFATILHSFCNKMFVLRHVGSWQYKWWICGGISRFVLLDGYANKNLSLIWSHSLQDNIIVSNISQPLNIWLGILF